MLRAAARAPPLFFRVCSIPGHSELVSEPTTCSGNFVRPLRLWGHDGSGWRQWTLQ